MLVKHAIDLRLGDQIKFVKGTTAAFIFRTPSKDVNGLVTVVALERIFGPRIKVTVMDGTNPDYAHGPERYTHEFNCLELLELRPQPKLDD